MNGCRKNGFRLNVCVAMIALLFTGVCDRAFAAERESTKAGLSGRSSASDVMKFSELAVREAGKIPSSRIRKAQSRRKGSSVRLATEPVNGAVETSAQTPVAATSGTEASEPLFTAASSTPSPPPSASFLALNDNAVAYNPDTHGAVGPSHLMVTLSSEVRIQNRAGGVISTVTLDGFWGALGNSSVFDPRVLYDRAAERWIFTAICNPATSNACLLVAVSQNSDPTGTWYRHAIRVDLVDGVYAASPNIGLSRDWITIQANMFDQTGLFFFSSDIFVFNKTNLYAGGSATFTRFIYFPASEVGTPVPAVNFDPNFATSYLVADAGVIEEIGRLRLFSITGPVDNPVFNDFAPGYFIAAGAAFGTPTWATEPPVNDNFAPQLGTTNRIFIGDSRIQNVVYRNGALWATHHVFLPTNAPTRSAVQWWGFSPGGTVLQHGRMDDPTGSKFYAYPSIAVNRYEDVLIGYSRFAANQYPSANYAFHAYQDGPGRLQADTVLKAGEAKFTVADNSLILWGDWSASVVDPLNDTDLWTIQEYAATPVSTIERWGTWWGRVSPPASLSLNASASPDPMVAGSSVTYSIQITNNSSHIATGVRLVDTLPVGATFVSAALSQGTCLHSNGIVTCEIGDMPGGVTNFVIISGTIVARLNQGGSATNRMVVSSFGPDDLAADNSATLLTTVSTAADLAVTLSATPNVVILSNNVTYAMTVSNLGPSTATAVFATNVLPAGVVFVSASTTQGSCSQASGRVTCTLGNLAANAGAVISVVIRANVAGVLTSSAALSSAALDPNPANSSASLTTKASSLPILQPISNRTINEDTVLGPIAFTISDAETPADNLVLNGFSSNPAVVPAGNIVFGGSGANRTMTVTPIANANGAVTITRTLADGDGSVVSNSFVLTITAINDAPTISDIPSQSINEDVALGPVGFLVGDAETLPASLSLSSASSNPALIPNASIQFGGSGANRTVRIVPTTNQSGTATITLTVSDGVTSVSDTFVVTVNAVNDQPVISDVANRTINEDSSTPSLAFTVSDVETAATTLTVTGASSNPTLVPSGNIVIGGSGSSRTVAVTPAPNQFGTATITLTVNDGNFGTASDTFVLTVASVNDLPTMSAINPLTISEDAGVQSISLTGITAGAANESQTIAITAISSNPGLIPSPVTVSYTSPNSSGALSFAPSANSNGVANIIVTANDGAGSNNIVSRVFTVTVVPVNDPPFISTIADSTINEDTSMDLVAFTIGDVESSASSLSVSGRSSNTNLVPNGGILFGGSGSNRTVAVTPAANQFGATTITVLVTDGATTNSRPFVLTVEPVNDLPSIASIANRAINEDEGTNISFTISDLETAAGSLTLNASSSNPALISDISFGGAGDTRTINIVPATNQSGSASITVTVIDADGGSNSTAFALSVLPVNDPPTLDTISDFSVEEDAGLQTILLSGITSGAVNENQALSVTAFSDGTDIITNLAVIYFSPNAAGVLRFLPVFDASGTSTVTVVIDDGLATNSRTFNVVVAPVNDLPSISPFPNLLMDEDATIAFPFVVGDVETPADQLMVKAVSSNPELLDETGISFSGSGSNRTIRLTPLQDQSGASTIVTITVADGNGGVSEVSFELIVNPVNDAPTISGLSNLVLAEDSSSGALPFMVTDAESFPSSLLVSASSSNPLLIPDGNITLGGEGLSRTVSVLPLTNQFGETVVSVVVRDGDGPEAGSSTNTFLVTVSPVNDAPAIDPIGSLVVPMNAGLQSINLTGIGAGATNEFQSLTITAISSDPTLIPTPVIDYTSPSALGLLRFSPVPNAIGHVEITVTISDDGGTLDGGINQMSRTFSVHVSDAGPTLLIERIDGQAIVSWSTNSPLIWTLESTTNVSVTSSWSAAGETPVIINDRHTVTNSMAGAARFYRLRNGRDSGLALSIAPLGGNIVVSWSTNSPLSWTLESTTDLSIASSWAVVSQAPVMIDGRYTVTNSSVGAMRFYRLRSP